MSFGKKNSDSITIIFHMRGNCHACKIILSSSLPFLPKNACKQNPCKNNATCQAGFTDRDYQCLCVDGSGFKGHNCDEGKKSYFYLGRNIMYK